MASDYEKIRSDNIKRYGTDIGRIGPMLLSDRYDERTHFIFELLQNAEDALQRLNKPSRSRAVSFNLERDTLQVSHYGDPFSEPDVRGICGIDESTKKINEIGRFGIGFKSVYAFTDQPEIHSGAEDFAIEEFVRPIAANKIQRDVDKTVILIPFKESTDSAYDEIYSALLHIGAPALRFLRQIDEISWHTEDGLSGQYLREATNIDSNVRRVNIIGEQHDKSATDEEWLIFSQPIVGGDGAEIRPIEIAFLCVEDGESRNRSIRRVDRSPLVVFFPTAVETHLGFLVQGPYRTTPSRDNIPRDDAWNQSLVKQTAALLRRSLCWLRDHHMLETEVLRTLPLDPARFGDGTMFAPLFEYTKDSLLNERLLPRDDEGFTAASNARLGRTRDLRALFSASQLSALGAEESDLAWLKGDITQDRTPELREYLMRELDVAEYSPENVIRRLNRQFLESQSDDWIRRLYEYLNDQSGLHRWLADMHIIRLENGTHVAPSSENDLLAFLPTETATSFPTVRASVCSSKSSRGFLITLGLKEPDPVDDVITNVLPKYLHDEDIDVADTDYEFDISRILTAFGTDSQAQRQRLVENLRKSRFVRSVDASNGVKDYVKPAKVYLATDRLRGLLDGVEEVYFVDDSHKCLRGEDIRAVLEASGATRYLKPVSVLTRFTNVEKRDMRIGAGCENTTGGERIEDWTLRGLGELLTLFPKLDPDAQRARAKLLWDALGELESRRGKATFSGTYSWFYFHHRETPFDATFVRRLNQARWVPQIDGTLHRPEFVSFESLDWKSHPFLESVIRFKPPEVDVLARKLRIEPEMIELLREVGIATESVLRERLGLSPREEETSEPHGEGEASEEDEPEHQENGQQSSRGRASRSGDNDNAGEEKKTDDARRTPHPKDEKTRSFISYVAVHAEEQEEADPDNLTQKRRMALEDRAIELILKCEPGWQRTPSNNPGFDLFRTDERGQDVFCEVKAMTGTLQDRPVGMSRTQFKHASDHGDLFWLYIVERADDVEEATIVRIQNPAGKARTFTFDRGWSDVHDPKGFEK